MALAVFRIAPEPFPLGSRLLYVARTFLSASRRSDKTACHIFANLTQIYRFWFCCEKSSLHLFSKKVLQKNKSQIYYSLNKCTSGGLCWFNIHSS